jgi:parallel beta-helix repeat protein
MARWVYNKSQGTSYENLQDAIDDASSGDEIVVYPGTYYGGIDFDGNAITLRSACPNDYNVTEATVIDGNGTTNVVAFGTGSEATLRGLTITGGSRGIYCTENTPTVSNCVIRNNNSEGVYAESSTLDIKNNLIYDNNAGMVFEDAEGTVRNNTIVNNTDYGIQVSSGDGPAISNCIPWANTDDLNGCSATYSCIQDGDSGTGNISDDPCFVDADNNDFHISKHSPCVNRGDPNGDYTGQTDIDGEPRVFNAYVDMGADEVGFSLPDPFPDAHY